MRNKKWLLNSALFLLVFLSIAPSILNAQRLTGNLTGAVTDERGAPLPGVTVELSSPALLGGIHSQTTSDKGTYRFVNLPPGAYKVTFRLQGFQAVDREDIRISVGSAVTVDVALKQATLEESITVVAQQPTIDLQKSGMSTNFSKEDLNKLPVGRFSHFDVVKMAAGIQLTDEYSIWNVAYGSNVESNAVLLDGVDITNPDVGIGWHYIPSDTFEEVEATGIGAPAEFGQFTGAVINIVTRSGGNNFQGSASYFGQYDNLTADNNPEPGTYSYHREKFYYASGTLGGPIIKDKVWFFGTFEKMQDSASFWLTDPDYPNIWPGTKAFLKLSSQLTPKHRLSGYAYYEFGTSQDTENPYYEPEALGREEYKVPTWNLLYTFLINNDAFFELKYSGYRYIDDYLPMYADLNTPPHYDGRTGVYSQGLWWPWKYEVGRDQVNASVSYFAEDFLAGDHDFKAGVQYNRGMSTSYGGFPGGIAYYDYGGYYYNLYKQDVFYYGGVVNALGIFVDDTWKISKRLTANLGLRFDHNKASIPAFPVMNGWNKTSEMNSAIDNLITFSSLSPRVGLAFQLTDDRKTVLKANYGRYYDKMVMSNWNYPGPNVTDWSWFYYDWDIGDWVLQDLVPGAMNYHIDPDYQTPHSDQFSLGLEREIAANLSIGLTLIYKKEKNLIGWEDRGAEYEPVTRVSPDNGTSYTVWNQTSPLGSNDYWITNPPGYEQTYKAAIIGLNKRYSDNWLVSASLTWSRNTGLNNVAHTAFQESTIYSAGNFGKDPNDLINSTGLLQFDRPWMFKVQAGYNFPWDIMASVNYVYQTGTPLFTLVRIFGLSQDPPDTGRDIMAEPRSDQKRLEAWSMLDFRLEKTVNLHRTLRFRLMLDVFNVFNSNTATSLASYRLWTDNYHEPNFIFFPRRLQLGFRLEF
jgi:hypothetical protein